MTIVNLPERAEKLGSIGKSQSHNRHLLKPHAQRRTRTYGVVEEIIERDATAWMLSALWLETVSMCRTFTQTLHPVLKGLTSDRYYPVQQMVQNHTNGLDYNLFNMTTEE
ncbi:unnamed protein product [Thlaspi arvense]|uniref:Uncharacterized protein n=1 Tax=Thlaspi arvense TaxID=13288 RepID=A0AAU9SKN7_THLAR|nr:unnamed protein product [Thlaspi arvense]